MALAAGAPGTENPSAAFLAGQQHGQQLATKHAATTKPAAKPAAAPTRKPAATASGSATVNDLLAQAKRLAAADTNAQVAAIKSQQTMLTTQGQDRARQINEAAKAAAEFLSGLGDKTAASYTQAGKDLAGIAQGYSGQTRTDATSAADQVAANLALLGAPAGAAKTATGETVQPEALSNVLYGLGGAMPASTLLNAGQLQAAVQRGLPASMLGYGQQQAAGTVAAGQKAAQDLIPQLLSAKAGLPAATRQYLSTLSGLASDEFNQKLALAKYNTGIDQFNVRTKIQVEKLNLEADRFARTTLNQDRSYQLALDRLGLSRVKEQRAALAQEYKLKNGGFTNVQVNKFQTDAEFVASQAETAKTKPTVAEAMQKMYERHVPLSIAKDALKSVYGDVFGGLQLKLVGVGQQADPFASGPSGSKLGGSQLAGLWIQAGGDPALARTMAAIALAESGGRMDALNATAPDYSVGPWQVNYYGNLRSGRTRAYGTPELLRSDPLASARAAVDIYNRQGLGAWSTFTNGAYRRYLGS